MSTWDDKANDYDHAVEQIARLKAELAAERERCAKIADERAALWAKSVEAGAHAECAMSLLEECEDIAAAIRRQKSE